MRTVLAVALAAVATIAVPAAQSDVPTPVKFTAFAVDTSTMTTRARTGTVDVVINKWSPDADRDRLLQVFRDKGQDALLSELQKLPKVGYITTPGSLRYDLHFARQRSEPEGGHMIFMMTDRYINSWEARNQPRTIDYPFMLIQLRVDKKGEGEGKASIYTKITETKNGTIELENFANQPVALTQVKMIT
jgi:hypothetical protein